MATFPVNKEGQTSVAPLGGEAWTVPVTGDEAKQAKAAEFVKCLNSDENADAAGQESGSVSRPSWPWPSSTRRRCPRWPRFATQVATARARTGKLGDKWPETAKTIYTGMQLVLTGQAAPADAMAKAGAS